MSTQGAQLVLAAPGMIFDYAGSTAPTGFLFCDGAAVSRSTFARLFAVIGTNFGAGDGSTTFNLPDLRGRVTAAPDNMGGTAANRLQVTFTMTTTSGSTTATVSSSLDAERLAENMTIRSANYNGVISLVNGTTLTLENPATATGTVTARASFLVDSQVLGSSGGTQAHKLRSTEMPVHAHNANGSAPSSLSAGSNFVRNTNTNTATITTDTAGGDRPHLNVQPTLLVNKIIKT